MSVIKPFCGRMKLQDGVDNDVDTVLTGLQDLANKCCLEHILLQFKLRGKNRL